MPSVELGVGRALPRPHRLDRPVDQPAVVVAAHVDGIERHQHVHRSSGVERPARHVAEIDDVGDISGADVGKDGLQCEMVSVDVGDRGKAHLVVQFRTAACR